MKKTERNSSLVKAFSVWKLFLMKTVCYRSARERNLSGVRLEIEVKIYKPQSNFSTANIFCMFKKNSNKKIIKNCCHVNFVPLKNHLIIVGILKKIKYKLKNDTINDLHGFE